MVKISVGTAGWDYKDWRGTFYPEKIDKQIYLGYYSKFFDIVEINSSFYNLPSIEMVKNWIYRVPQNFRFIIKVWKEITHNLSEYEIHNRINIFFERFELLENKILGFLFQFPPRFNYSKNHYEKLKNLTNHLPKKQNFLYFLELRDDSWFSSEKLTDIIDGKKFLLVTTYKPGVKPYYYPNQNIYYIRLIGNRELTIFNRIQRDQQESFQELFMKLRILEKSANIYEIFILVNNHFQGHAPTSANYIKKRLGLPFKTFKQQKSLIDYFK